MTKEQDAAKKALRPDQKDTGYEAEAALVQEVKAEMAENKKATESLKEEAHQEAMQKEAARKASDMLPDQTQPHEAQPDQAQAGQTQGNQAAQPNKADKSDQPGQPYQSNKPGQPKQGNPGHEPVAASSRQKEKEEGTVGAASQEQPSFWKKYRPWIVLGLIALVLIIYFAVPGVKEGINNALSRLTSGNMEDVMNYIRSYKGYAALISFALMVLTSILAPIPAFLITIANANIFGWWQGAILSWSSAMVGAAFCFFIARGLGRNIVEKIVGKGALHSIERYFVRYGQRTILVCRLLPFVSFDLVSYFAGLTPMNFWSFFLATGIGQTPATIVYSYVGGQLSGGAQKLFVGLMTLFAIAIIITIIRQIYVSRHDKDSAKQAS